MSHVVSADGTPIAFDRAGDGPAVVLVGGGLDDGADNGPLAAELAARYTVYNQGMAHGSPPYAVAREIEDIVVVIAAPRRRARPVHAPGRRVGDGRRGPGGAVPGAGRVLRHGLGQV